MDSTKQLRRPGVWRWHARPVDTREDHFELRYGSMRDSDWSELLPVARIIDNTAPGWAKAFGEVKAELDFYPVTKGELDPWEYAKHHCSRSANVYSAVHWTFHIGR